MITTGGVTKKSIDTMIPFFTNKLKLAVKARQRKQNGNQSRSEQQPWNPPNLRKTMPPTNVAIPRKSSLPSPSQVCLLEKQMELEQHLMKNPLSRGLGRKPVKVLKQLIGTNSIRRVIEKVQREEKQQLLKSPERGLGHIIKERTPKPGMQIRNCQIDIETSIGSTSAQGHSITEIMSLLLPCLYIGYTIWQA